MFPMADLHTHPFLFRGRIDLPRIRESGVKLITGCVYAFNRLPYRSCFEAARAQIEKFHRWIAENSDLLAHAKSPSEIEPIISSGKIALLLALEGGHHLGGRLENLSYFKEQGIFYMTLVHFLNTKIAKSSLFARFSPEPALRSFGREVIREMNRKGIIVDVAHCSERAFWEVMECSKVPPIYSHGASKAICRHHRNLTDDQAAALAKRGGLLGLILYPWYLRRHSFRATMEDLLRHLERWLAVAGPDAVSIGSDIGGVMPLREVGDYSGMPRLQEAIVKAFGEATAKKILFENVINYLKKCWQRPV